MKIHQIISENRNINEGRFSWLDDTYKWFRGFTKAGKEAERIIKELEYLAPGIDKAAERYADMVTKAREEFKKPPSIDFFLKQTVPNWASRVADEQEAIKQALMNATRSKLAEREAVKAAAKNPQAPTPPPPVSNQPPAKVKKQKKQRIEAQPTAAQVQAAETAVKAKMSKSGWLSTVILGAGFVDITYKSYSDVTYYQELFKAEDITEEELGIYYRAVAEQWVLKFVATGFLAAGAGGILGGIGKAVGVSPTAVGIPFFKTIVNILKHVWPERVLQIGGKLLGQASAMVIAHWLQYDKDHQKNVAWLIWDYIDPAVVGVANAGKKIINANVEGARLEMSKLLDEVEAAKNSAPNAEKPAAQSGQDTTPDAGAQQPNTVPAPAANTVPPKAKIDPATGNNPDSDDAWNRLLNYK